MTVVAAGAPQPISGPDVAARRSGASDAGFMVPASPERSLQQNAGGTGDVSAVIDTSAMLALQEDVDREGTRSRRASDRQARRHGQDILAALAALQADLLGDAALGRSLNRLAALLDTPAEALDPGLAAVLTSITLRARLELLRLAPRVPVVASTETTLP